MVRMLGAVLVAAGAAWMGFQAAGGLRGQIRELRHMAGGLALLEGELELNAAPLPRLLARGAARSEGAASALFEGCAQGLDRLDQEDFSSLWRGQVGQRKEFGPEGQAVLAPLGEVLGRYGEGRQRECLSAARRRLEELAARLEAESRSRVRVYEALGLSGGAFLVILLL